MDREEKANQLEMDRISRFKKVFSGPDGDKVVLDLIAAYALEGTFDENPHRMYWKEGRRSVIMELLEILEVDPHQYRKQLQEIADYQQEFSID